MDVGIDDPSPAWLLAEARHVVGLIEDGGSIYADDRDGGLGLLLACRAYVRKVTAVTTKKIGPRSK